jgi:hypothetical protein
VAAAAAAAALALAARRARDCASLVRGGACWHTSC